MPDLKIDNYTLANRIGEALEELAGADGYADSLVLDRATIHGTFNLMTLAERILTDFHLEVR